MKNTASLSLAVMPLLAFMLCIPCEAADKEPLNSEWLRLDVETIALVKKHLPPEGETFKGFTSSLNRSDYHKTRDMGFGNRRHIFSLGGGYSRLIITVLGREDRIAALRIDCDGSTEWPRIRDTIMEEWGKLPSRPIPEGFRYEYIDEGLFSATMPGSPPAGARPSTNWSKETGYR
jgi:hypothetical protein